MNQVKTIDAKLIGYTTVAALLGMGFAAAMSASAHGGEYMMGMRGEADTETRVAIEQALENEDTEALMTLLQDSHPDREISTDRVETMIERYDAQKAHHEAMEEILSTGDYEAWVAFMSDRPRIADVITEDNFNKYIEMHKARTEGDMETWTELREELGLPMHGHGMHGKHGGGEQGERDGAMHRGMGSGDGEHNNWKSN